MAVLALCGVGLPTASCQPPERPAPGADERHGQAARRSLIRQADLCGACDPACNLVTDAPQGFDLTPENSIGLTYDQSAGGLVLDGASSGRYTRRIDGRIPCAGQLEAYWDQLYYDADCPDGASLTIEIQTADRADDLDGAEAYVVATIPGAEPPADLGGVLDEHSAQRRRYLQVSVELATAPDGASPVFRTMGTVLYCACACDAGDGDCTPGCRCDWDC
jgi:hypothetical protein